MAPIPQLFTMGTMDRKTMISIQELMRAYFVAKASGVGHVQALQSVVHTWYYNSPTRAHEFWSRYWRIQADAVRSDSGVSRKDTKNALQLKHFIYCLVHDRQTLLVEAMIVVAVNIERTYAVVKAEFKHVIM
jgi:hypothetical protein